MNLKARAEQVGGTVLLQINTEGASIINTHYLDIKEAERLKDELIVALQGYDAYMAERDKAANEYMEEGESLDSILTSMEKG